MKKLKELIGKIKEKRELSDLPDSLVEESINNFLLKNKIALPQKEKDVNIITKEVRAQLRKYTGRFQINSENKKREIFLKKDKIEELLRTHTSTKERIEYYPEIIGLIKKINPQSVLDLGCGLNPIAITNIIKDVEYYAYDIKERELLLVDKFFKMNKINGKTFFSDIRKEENFPEADLCLMFKLLDILEEKGHKITNEIIKKIKCRKIIASFSTKTLSGKPMNSPRRQWFENMLKNLNYSFEIFKIPNEVFYIMSRILPSPKA